MSKKVVQLRKGIKILTWVAQVVVVS